MEKIRFSYLLSAGVVFSGLCFSANAAEVVVGDDKTSGLAISVYNNDLAFVRDTRSVMLNQGENVFAFEGVAKQLKPETARIRANGVSVVEQNYDFNLINLPNMLQENIGKEVKTALFNPQTGQTVFDKALIVNSNFGSPVLQFSYGIETDFPGRVIFDNIPEHLRKKPTLVATLNSAQAGQAPIQMAYLTGGVSWKADYIADVKADNTLALNGWITLTNNSGVDYKNALVQVVAGNINMEEMVVNYAAPRMMKTMAMGAAMDTAESAPMPAMEAMGAADYYLYTLPQKTTIKDMQSKQVNLLSKDNVKFEKKYILQSPLHLSFYSNESEFLKANPVIAFKMANKPENNLGLPLPKGIVRFYENDSKGNSQFLGESRIDQLAVGEETELKLGKSFDVFSKGKILNKNNISKEIVEIETEITFNNAKSEAVKVEFLQGLSNRWEMLSETIKSEKKNSSTAKWDVQIPANGETKLTFKIRFYTNK